MIHYSCDRCGRPIDSTNELRYVVTLDIRAKMDGLGPSHQEEDDQDLLQTLEEVLETSDSQESDFIADDVDQHVQGAVLGDAGGDDVRAVRGGRVGRDEAVGSLVTLGHRARARPDVGAQLAQPLHDGPSGPLGTSGDERPASVETVAICVRHRVSRARCRGGRPGRRPA